MRYVSLLVCLLSFTSVRSKAHDTDMNMSSKDQAIHQQIDCAFEFFKCMQSFEECWSDEAIQQDNIRFLHDEDGSSEVEGEGVNAMLNPQVTSSLSDEASGHKKGMSLLMMKVQALHEEFQRMLNTLNDDKKPSSF